MAYTKEHYLATGYVDHGYFSPELSSQDTYPDYIKESVDQCVERIQSHQNRRSVSFALLADVHYSDSPNHNVRTERLVNSCREIGKRVALDKVFLDGDHVNDGHRDYKLHQYRELRAHMWDLNYYPVNGNHDSNIIWDQVIESQKPTHWLGPEELYKHFFNHLPALGACFPEKDPGLYYYVDNTPAKLRYICVDTVDMPVQFDNETKKLYHEFTISQNQLDWLVRDAMAVPDEGWGLVFLTHMAMPPSKENPRITRETQYLEILSLLAEAYNAGGVLKGEFFEGLFRLNVDVDFSCRTRGQIIGFFSGHEHCDFIEYSPSGIPYIYTGCTIMYDSDSAKAPRRYDGEITELLYDVVTVDRDAHKIYLTRVGAGQDRVASYP